MKIALSAMAILTVSVSVAFGQAMPAAPIKPARTIKPAKSKQKPDEEQPATSPQGKTPNRALPQLPPALKARLAEKLKSGNLKRSTANLRPKSAKPTALTDPYSAFRYMLESATDHVLKIQRKQEAKRRAHEQKVLKAHTKRLSKIRALQFDRSSAAILEVWKEQAKNSKAKAGKQEPANQKLSDANFDTALEAFRENVVLGNWNEVQSFLSQLSELDAEFQKLNSARKAAPKNSAVVMTSPGSASGTNSMVVPPEFEAMVQGSSSFSSGPIIIEGPMGPSITMGGSPARPRAGVTKPEQSADSKPLGFLAYEHMLDALTRSRPSPQARRLPPQARKFADNAVITCNDVLALIRCAPGKLAERQLVSLGQLLDNAVQHGHALHDFISIIEKEIKAKKDPLTTPRNIAKILFAANQPNKAGNYLPKIQFAAKANDFEGLNLIAQFHISQYATTAENQDLEKAWEAVQTIFNLPKPGPAKAPKKDNKKGSKQAAKPQQPEADEDYEKQIAQALTYAVELAPKLRSELGQAWLESSFTKDPERGMEILAVIGTAAAQGLEKHPRDSKFRLKGLELQSIALNALLEKAPKLANQWQLVIQLLAQNWWREASFSQQFDTSTESGPRMQRDSWGNVYYARGFARPRNKFDAIPTAKILKFRPTTAHVKLLEKSAQSELNRLLAMLYLKVKEEDKAFPYIQTIANGQPEVAKKLIEEFLEIWAEEHNPNANRGRNRYMYMYGFQARAESIPLTRSKQERNLKELANWIKRVKALNIGDLDESLLIRAFTNCHSQAEVYRLEAIAKVFGPLENLKPKTLAALIQQMRVNLAGLWRAPKVQKANKTKRRKKDIEAEVMRGYQVAQNVAISSLAKHKHSWRLQLAKAAVLHDLVNYRSELRATAKFAVDRRQCFAEFANASKLYKAQVLKLKQSEWNQEVYNYWFAASLGASDLNSINSRTPEDPKQFPLIKQALESLPKAVRDEHIEGFAASLFSKMGEVRPEIKFRYLKRGFEIVGDHPAAAEAKKVMDYYNDLVTEIQLTAKLDGDDVIGHKAPFGVFIALKHTREIERESGGFARYLQNQNTGRYYYNFGRPKENYRDKFEEAARTVLNENFEVLSVTFQKESVNSRAIENEYGWRETPYAYLLLRARGPEVDKLPALRLDLDFLDTSGYVVLPIESSAVALDAGSESEVRPCDELEVIQILDERQAKDGKLIVEVKAKGNGLVPELDSLLDFPKQAFEKVAVDDQGLSVAEFNNDRIDTPVISERTWLVTFNKKDNAPAKELTEFRFAKAKLDDITTIHQRYVDEDLVTVKPVVSLRRGYGGRSKYNYWIIGIGLVVLVLIRLLLPAEEVAEQKVVSSTFSKPEQLTPVTVQQFLKSIQNSDLLSTDQHKEIKNDIDSLEKFYFSQQTTKKPDLESLASRWHEKTYRS